MTAADDYPAIAVLYDAWKNSGRSQPESCRALAEIDALRARVAALEAALTYAITHEHDDDLEGTR